MRPVSDGWFKCLAIEERESFQGLDSKKEPDEQDRTCLCCQTRIDDMVQQELSGNTMKMKFVLQRSKL